MSIFEEEPGRRTSANLLTRDEARPVAANIIRFVEAHDHVSVGLVVTYPTDEATALDRRAGEAIERDDSTVCDGPRGGQRPFARRTGRTSAT